MIPKVGNNTPRGIGTMRGDLNARKKDSEPILVEQNGQNNKEPKC